MALAWLRVGNVGAVAGCSRRHSRLLELVSSVSSLVTKPLVGIVHFEVIEVIDLILDFIVPPHQIGRVWRHQSLRITARLGEDRETPGSCMAHYPTDHRRGVSAGTAGVGGTSGRGRHQGGRNNWGPVRARTRRTLLFLKGGSNLRRSPSVPHVTPQLARTHRPPPCAVPPFLELTPKSAH